MREPGPQGQWTKEVEHEVGTVSQDPELKTLARTLGDVADTLLGDLRKLGENSGPHQV